MAGRAALARVLRLDRAVRTLLGVRISALLDPDWKSMRTEVLSQRLGRLAFDAGIEGLLVPSAIDRNNGVNLVAFPDNLEPGSYLEAEGLPGVRRRRPAAR